MTTKITTATPEQWAEIDRVCQKWIDLQTTQYPDEVIQGTVQRMFNSIEPGEYKAQIADSPAAAIKLATAGTTEQPETYWSFWWNSWAGWYEGAQVLGVQFDEDKFSLFRDWSLHCPFVCGPNLTVSRRPVEIHWQNGVLHNTSGKSVRFADDWGIWTIEGVSVDEQIVMHPDTQTIKQIHEEANEEVRRIRIDRFGWDRYLKESGSVRVDRRFNERDQQWEELFRTPTGEVRISLKDPSTGRQYFMGVPKETKTCVESQDFMSHGLEKFLSHRS